jgi:hypothetical protein
MNIEIAKGKQRKETVYVLLNDLFQYMKVF